MKDEKTKTKIIKELERTGNVWYSCEKSGVSRATYYRWRHEDRKFRQRTDQAVRRGQECGVDIAEFALMNRIKDKDMNAIKYYLSHNSPRYKTRIQNQYVFIHRKEDGRNPKKEITMEDVIDELEKRSDDTEESERSDVPS